MPQDFAKKRNTASKSSKKAPAKAATRKAGQPENHWSWFFTGLFSGVLVCVVGYFSLIQLRTSDTIADLGITGQSEDEPEGAGTELEFYEYLPQAEVEVNVIPVEIAQSVVEEENPTTYFLQAGSFLDPNDAEALRARLILLNLNTSIQATPLSGRTWYRVQAGPFVGRNMVETAENTLRENNIDPLRLRATQ